MGEEKEKCPICGGSGWIDSVDDQGYEFTKPCKCQIATRQIQRLSESGLANTKEQTIDKFIAREEWQRRIMLSASDYIGAGGDHWFYIGGAVGAGKTHLCTGICVELIKQGLTVKYAIWRDVAAELKAMRNTEEFTRSINALKRAHVLYLDDFLKGTVTEADKNLAFEILNSRYTARRKTIISSELFLSDVRKIDEAIGSRIYQMAKGGFIHAVAEKEGRNQRTRRKSTIIEPICGKPQG